jgi:Endoplasmic reticulum vesicle transporter
MLENFDFFRISSDSSDTGIYEHRKSAKRKFAEFILVFSVLSFPILKAATLERQPSLLVDTDFTRDPIKLSFEIEFDYLPCEMIGANFLQGTSSYNIETKTLELDYWKRSPETGDLIKYQLKPEELQRKSLLHEKLRPVPSDGSACPSCYGATDEVCCDTCDDVMFAYRLKNWALPMKEKIEQCVNPVCPLTPPEEKTENKSPQNSIDNKSCVISGSVSFPKVPSQLNFNVLRTSLSDFNRSDIKTQHILRKFEISTHKKDSKTGELFPISSNQDSVSHQYYISVASGVQEAFHRRDLFRLYAKYFPITENTAHATQGVHLKIDFEPVKVIEHTESFADYGRTFVDWLGFLGGFVSIVVFFA